MHKHVRHDAEGFSICQDCERAWGTGLPNVPKNPPRKCNKDKVQKINREIKRLKDRLDKLSEDKVKLKCL